MVSAREEIEHAQLCFSFASQLAGHPISPGPYEPHTLHITGDLDALIEEVLLSGGLTETSNVLADAIEAAATTDPTVMEFHIRNLEGSASCVAEANTVEEGRHAAFAWRTVRWGLGESESLDRTELKARISAHPVLRYH